MRFFFYGSLLDAAIRAAVMGPAAAGCRAVPASLVGWRRRACRHAIYPVLKRKRGGRVSVCLVDGVDPAAAARLTAFEGRNYRVATVYLQTEGGRCTAYVFLPSRRIADPGEWNEADWLRGRKARALRDARALLGWLGRKSVREARGRWQACARLSESPRSGAQALAAGQLVG
jgi:gamma-glutamylcyclotransferase (GGCT)/AIG2-like uncharacterized protein YtfP